MNSQRFQKNREAGKRGSGRNLLIRSLFYYFAITFLAFQFPPASLAQKLTTISDYANRLNQAEQAINEVIERESPTSELVARMNAVKRLLPANEEIEFMRSTIRVDNAWFHEALNNVVENAEGDIEQRHSMLREISDRLANLQRSVKQAQNLPDQALQDQALQDQRAQLANILARSEYQHEEKHESILQGWIRKIKNFIVRLLEKLFGGSSAREPRAGGAGLVTVFRILVFLAVIAALMFGAAKFARRLQARKRPAEEAEGREVLGEEIAEDATATDLFARASELARQGEYRKAIRRAYIALLCDLEQHGKLRLHRSKTNRDYLDAMRSEHRMYPAFSVMTNAFEHIWYGQERATEEEFKDFAALYQETVK